MNPSVSPAIVAQTAVPRLPRLALLLLCLVYVGAGFVGREPWKSADLAGFGYMAVLAGGGLDWLHPLLLGQAPETRALLPYWLGAWALQLAPVGIEPTLAVRIPFMIALWLTLAASWYASYHLAHQPLARPLSFAFGGEAETVDYARALADASLLALMACLGLAQLVHETTPAVLQLCGWALSFYALALLPTHPFKALPVLLAGHGILVLSGAPTLALLLGLGAAAGLRLDPRLAAAPSWHRLSSSALIGLVLLSGCLLAWQLDLYRWNLDLLPLNWSALRLQGRLLLWFTWPAWPLALWALWRWRRHWRSWHLALPLWLTLLGLLASFSIAEASRALLLALPALATLAAFALPTLSRTVSALIDWFTLLFFSGCALVVWVVWLAMQTGWPAQPAANVARLVPGFVPQFSALALALALLATLAWGWLLHWRVGRHQKALWKSLVLPASGAGLCWLLLMTLWLPLLDYARSYAALMHQITSRIEAASAALPPSARAAAQPCIEAHGLTRAQSAALLRYSPLPLRLAAAPAHCHWLLSDGDRDARQSLPQRVDLSQWQWLATLRRPSDDNESVFLYQRVWPD